MGGIRLDPVQDPDDGAAVAEVATIPRALFSEIAMAWHALKLLDDADELQSIQERKPRRFPRLRVAIGAIVEVMHASAIGEGESPESFAKRWVTEANKTVDRLHEEGATAFPTVEQANAFRDMYNQRFDGKEQA